jgi:hypothetical protein
MMNLGALKLGESVAIALTTETMRKFIEEVTKTAEVQESLFHLNCIREDSHYQKEYLKKVFETLPATRLDEIITAPVYPLSYTMKMKGRNHSYLLAADTTTVTFNVKGVGLLQMKIVPGWTLIDYPDGTEISIATGGSATPLLYRVSDEIIPCNLPVDATP